MKVKYKATDINNSITKVLNHACCLLQHQKESYISSIPLIHKYNKGKNTSAKKCRAHISIIILIQ